MATAVAEVLRCGGAHPHRIVWRGNEPELLDHDGETGLDGSVGCVGRVLAWWRTGIVDISALARGHEHDHDDALWSATNLAPEVIAGLRAQCRPDSPGDILRARAVGMPVRADGAIDDRGADPTSWQPLRWLVAARPPERWRCPSCAIELDFEDAWPHWEQRGDCYWRRGRAEREGWMRATIDVTRWTPSAPSWARTHLRMEHHGSPTAFVRSAADGLTTREIVDAAETIRRRHPDCSDADVADHLASLDRLQVIELARSTVTTDLVSEEQP